MIPGLRSDRDTAQAESARLLREAMVLASAEGSSKIEIQSGNSDPHEP